MAMSSNGNIFCVTGPFCGEFTGHWWIPLTKANDAELWSFLCSAPWINGWINNRDAGDFRRHRNHYDVIVRKQSWKMVRRSAHTTEHNSVIHVPILNSWDVLYLSIHHLINAILIWPAPSTTSPRNLHWCLSIMHVKTKVSDYIYSDIGFVLLTAVQQANQTDCLTIVVK